MKIVADIDIAYLKNFFSHDDLALFPGREIKNDHLKDADGLIIRSVTRVDESLLKNTNVKWIVSVTAGFDHIDINYLEENNIAWCNAKGFNAPPVADYVVATIAALINADQLPNQKRAVVIGVGQVGSLVVERLKTIGFEVLEVDPIRSEHEADFSKTRLDDISEVDLIAIHTPLTRDGNYPTFHMINADFLKRQKSDCILLNAARGEVVDSKALLSHGKHLTICLDVFEDEPNIASSILQCASIATPHIAGHSLESKLRGVKIIYQWLAEKKWIESVSNIPAISEYRVAIPKNCTTWCQATQFIFDVIKISQVMLINANEMKNKFDEIRKHYGDRHEFSNIILENVEHLDKVDLMMLKNFGFKF